MSLFSVTYFSVEAGKLPRLSTKDIIMSLNILVLRHVNYLEYR